jgi:hypothetical protein
VDFDEFFENKTLRIDYFHTGNKTEDFYSIDELKEEPFWGGSKTNLIDNLKYGNYMIMVYDESSKELIFSRGYSTLFREWQTTDEATLTDKSFSETVTMPFPKKPVVVEFHGRDKKNNFIKRFEYKIDPLNYFITTEQKKEYPSFKVVDSGDPANCVDVVILPEGYTAAEMEMFKKDCEEFAGYLFNSTPFKENKEKFNIWGVEAPSEESGTDIPAKDTWKKTQLNTTFYTFDLERYCMTSDNKSVRDVAANAPYDQIYILVNSDVYGGGAIYNHYAVCVNKNKFEEYVFVHEFGHAFASLADEYYTSDVAYNEFYPLDVEPSDPNVTTLVDFDSKWKDMIDEDTPVPTPNDKQYADVVGVFEGGGYVAKGVYRPELDCQMNSLSVNNFCEVCKMAILKMIDFHTQ